jgi:hypothetical protein
MLVSVFTKGVSDEPGPRTILDTREQHQHHLKAEDGSPFWPYGFRYASRARTVGKPGRVYPVLPELPKLPGPPELEFRNTLATKPDGSSV